MHFHNSPESLNKFQLNFIENAHIFSWVNIDAQSWRVEFFWNIFPQFYISMSRRERELVRGPRRRNVCFSLPQSPLQLFLCGGKIAFSSWKLLRKNFFPRYKDK